MASISTNYPKSSIRSKITAMPVQCSLFSSNIASGMQVYAQSGTFVTGKIVDDEAGKALVGVSVSIPALR